jgi:hypothetical protein
MERKDQIDTAIELAAASLGELEKCLGKLDRVNLRDLVELIPQTELHIRMARLRLQAVIDSRRSTDPDQTPVDPIRARRRDSQTGPQTGSTLRMPLPKPDDDKKG